MKKSEESKFLQNFSKNHDSNHLEIPSFDLPTLNISSFDNTSQTSKPSQKSSQISKPKFPKVERKTRLLPNLDYPISEMIEQFHIDKNSKNPNNSKYHKTSKTTPIPKNIKNPRKTPKKKPASHSRLNCWC